MTSHLMRRVPCSMKACCAVMYQKYKTLPTTVTGAITTGTLHRMVYGAMSCRFFALNVRQATGWNICSCVVCIAQQCLRASRYAMRLERICMVTEIRQVFVHHMNCFRFVPTVVRLAGVPPRMPVSQTCGNDRQRVLRECAWYGLASLCLPSSF